MLGSASGPLGALLMIAPLAAIPVFAIVGVPRIGPLAASPADEDDVLADDSSVHSPPAHRPRVKKSADDLFAPAGFRSRSIADERRPDSTAETGDTLRVPDAFPATGRGAQPRIPLEAIEDWEVATDARGSAPANGVREDSGGVSTRDFRRDLLQPPPSKTSTRKGAADAASRHSRNRTVERTPPIDAPLPPRGAEVEQPPTEQSGWQAAAHRLKALGITKYRLESRIEDQAFLFRCELSSPDNPHVIERFEADGESPLEAVEQVLDQIDQWQAGTTSASDDFLE
ncbi:MAG: hypothetical protein ACKV0T_26720 [Planctomycetales bacterium]